MVSHFAPAEEVSGKGGGCRDTKFPRAKRSAGLQVCEGLQRNS